MLFEQRCHFPMREVCLNECILYMKGLCRLDQMCSWGLRRGNPQVTGISLRFMSEWAEQMGEVARSPVGFRMSVLVLFEWLVGWLAAHLLLCLW